VRRSRGSLRTECWPRRNVPHAAVRQAGARSAIPPERETGTWAIPYSGVLAAIGACRLAEHEFWSTPRPWYGEGARKRSGALNARRGLAAPEPGRADARGTAA
jgi:hypothetical protein